MDDQLDYLYFVVSIKTGLQNIDKNIIRIIPGTPHRVSEILGSSDIPISYIRQEAELCPFRVKDL